MLAAIQRFGEAVDRYCSEAADVNLREKQALRTHRTTEAEIQALADEVLEFRANVYRSFVDLYVELSDACAEDEWKTAAKALVKTARAGG